MSQALVAVLVVIVVVTAILIYYEMSRPHRAAKHLGSIAEPDPLPPQVYGGYPPLNHTSCGPRQRPPTHAGVCPSLSQYYDWDGKCKWRPKMAYGMEVARGSCEYPWNCKYKGDICTRFGSCQKPFDF